MDPMIAQMLVQGHQHELAIEAAEVHLAATARPAIRPSRTGTPTGARMWIASQVSSLLAILR